MKKMKKLTALLLTLVMSLALAVPCFAAEPQMDTGKDAIYLEVGDTVVINGVTATLRKVDEAEAHSAARTVYTPITSTKTWTKYDMFYDSGSCRKMNGDMLGFEIDNRGGDALDMEVWLNLNDVNQGYEHFFCTVGKGMYELAFGKAFQFSNTVPAEWSIAPLGTPVNFTISAYQFWSFDN